VTVGSNRRQALEHLSQGGTTRLDFANIERGVEQISTYAQAHPLRAVLATDEATTVLAAAAAAALDLRCNPPEAVRDCIDKYRLRCRLADAGLPRPGFRRVSRDEDAALLAPEIDYPCVLKPLSLSASRGVIRADDEAGFVSAFQRIGRLLDDPATTAPRETRRYILVEDYVPGVEVALEALLDDGELQLLALFDKPDPLVGPFFEETLYITPSRLACTVQDAILAAVAQAVRALGLHDGPIHAELRLGPRGPVVIELAPRSIGGLCGRTLRFGVGVSLEELIVRHALRLPIESLGRERSPAGVMMLPIPRAGRLRAVEGLERARALPGIEDITIAIHLGQPVVPLPEGHRYLGFAFARAETAAAVETALRSANAALRFDIGE